MRFRFLAAENLDCDTFLTRSMEFFKNC